MVLVLVSTIPTGIIGYIGKEWWKKASATLIVPGICLILTSILLVVSEKTPNGKKDTKGYQLQKRIFDRCGRAVPHFRDFPAPVRRLRRA